MAIFALVSVLLFVVAGLSVDAGTSYLTSNKLERAAAAAALAGVAYLPGDYPDAQNAALVEAARDGFPNAGSGNACAGNPSPCVVTSQPTDERVEGHDFDVGVHDLSSPRRLRLAHRGAIRDRPVPSADLTRPAWHAAGSGHRRARRHRILRAPGGLGQPTLRGRPVHAVAKPDEHRLRRRGQRLVQRSLGARLPRDQRGSRHRDPGCNARVPGRLQLPDRPPPGCSRRTCRSTTPRSRLTRAVAAAPPTPYCYHENDSKLRRAAALPCTPTRRWSTRCSRFRQSPRDSQDIKMGQEIFYPYNATNVPTSYVPILPPHVSRMLPPPTVARHYPDLPPVGLGAELTARQARTEHWSTLRRARSTPPASTYDQQPGRRNGRPVLPPRGRHAAVERQRPSAPATVARPARTRTRTEAALPVSRQAHKGYAVRLVTPTQDECARVPAAPSRRWTT